MSGRVEGLAILQTTVGSHQTNMLHTSHVE